MGATEARLLATHCVICDTPLEDPQSVERGIGPTCWKNYINTDFGKLTTAVRSEAKALIYKASALSTDNRKEAVGEILAIATEVRKLGLPVLSDKIEERFITVRVLDVENDKVKVKTPYSSAFISAIRGIQREIVRDEKGKFSHYLFAKADKRRLFQALMEAFPGRPALSSKGPFVVPTVAEFNAKSGGK